MIEEPPVTCNIESKALWITINRPKVLNAINTKVFEEINRCLDEAEKNPEICAVVITGAGDKAFSAGADVTNFRISDIEKIKEQIKLGHKTILRLVNFPKPIIAAINGVALGGGCELAMACDLRIASENARFGQPEPRLGIIPGWGGTQLMPKILGVSRAKELLLTGRIIGAKDAENIGLVHKVVPLKELKETVMKVVDEISILAPLAVKTIKKLLTIQIEEKFEGGLDMELKKFLECYQTEDRIEGVTAFFEKRKPMFKGK